MTPTRARWALATCSALLLGTAGATARDVERPLEKTFTVAPGSIVTVGISAGSITVNDAPPGTVRVLLQQRVRGVNTDGEADRLLADYEVEIMQSGDRVSATAKGGPKARMGRRQGVSFSAVLSVPRDVRLDLKTSGGSITVRGERDRGVDAQTSGGSIRADGGRGDFTLSTSGGSITIGRALRTVDASTSGGSISVGHVGPEATDVSLNTSGGSIHVAIDPRATLTLRAGTSGGRVSVTDLPFVSARNSARTRSPEARGTINGGGGQFDAHTSGGSIEIRGTR